MDYTIISENDVKVEGVYCNLMVSNNGGYYEIGEPIRETDTNKAKSLLCERAKELGHSMQFGFMPEQYMVVTQGVFNIGDELSSVNDAVVAAFSEGIACLVTEQEVEQVCEEHYERDDGPFGGAFTSMDDYWYYKEGRYFN